MVNLKPKFMLLDFNEYLLKFFLFKIEPRIGGSILYKKKLGIFVHFMPCP